MFSEMWDDWVDMWSRFWGIPRDIVVTPRYSKAESDQDYMDVVAEKLRQEVMHKLNGLEGLIKARQIATQVSGQWLARGLMPPSVEFSIRENNAIRIEKVS